MAYTLSRYEQETHITWNAEEKTASVWTCDPATIRKLDKLVSQFPETYQCTEHSNEFAKYSVAAKFIRFGKPASEARIEAARRNAANMMKARTNDQQKEEA